MITACENCGAELEDTEVAPACEKCGLDGCCASCAGNHECDDGE